jgi:uncharacterized CHY-type Zn-finger protein
MDVMKSGYDLWQEKKYKSRFKDGGIECNACKKILKPTDYGSTKSRCKKCVTEYNKKRNQRSKQNLW